MAITQVGRLISINTPLGDDFLLLRKISASEGLSRLFSIDIELLHEEPKEGFKPTVIKPASILGKPVTMGVGQRDGSSRFFSGIVNRFSQGTRNWRYSVYYATVVPHVWILTQNIQSRIFQQMTVPDILRQVFEGFTISMEIQGEFKPRNYCRSIW